MCLRMTYTADEFHYTNEHYSVKIGWTTFQFYVYFTIIRLSWELLVN